ncbi:MAG: alternative oxidase [Pseudomonadota bacterium]
MAFDPIDTPSLDYHTQTDGHYKPRGLSDNIAFRFVKLLRFVADTFFAKRYGHRAVVLETVAAVPGMVGGLLQHLSAIRHIRDDNGWIRTLLDEAENERMHLMTFIKIAQPSRFERLVVMLTQAIFYNAYFFLYLFAPRTAHRVVGYFEEEAVTSYTQYLEEIDAGRHENIPAPQIAIDYWKLSPDARLRDVVIAVRADEAGHRDVNHAFADAYDDGRVGNKRIVDPRHQHKPGSSPGRHAAVLNDGPNQVSG